MRHTLDPLPKHSAAPASRRQKLWLLLVGAVIAMSAAVLVVVVHFGPEGGVDVPQGRDSFGAPAPIVGTIADERPAPAELPPDPSNLPAPTTSPAAAAGDRAASAPGGGDPSTVSESGAVMPAAAAPTSLTVETAGIDIAVLPLTPSAAETAGQSIVPPFTDDGYWLTPYGSPGAGSTNTTYIAGHSWEGREAPFDRLSTATAVGDTIALTTATGTIEYVIDSVTTYEKDTLSTSGIWNIVPNRLIIISCYTQDPWGKNIVVSAFPVGD